jgi:hypothetical protein
LEIDHLDLCLATADRRDGSFIEQIRTIALFQRAKDYTELRISQNAAEGCNFRNHCAPCATTDIVSQPGGEELLGRLGGKGR